MAKKHFYNFFIFVLLISIGVVIGLGLSVEYGLHDKYTQNLVEEETGKRYFTSTECFDIVNDQYPKNLIDDELFNP